MFLVFGVIFAMFDEEAFAESYEKVSEKFDEEMRRYASKAHTIQTDFDEKQAALYMKQIEAEETMRKAYWSLSYDLDVYRDNYAHDADLEKLHDNVSRLRDYHAFYEIASDETISMTKEITDLFEEIENGLDTDIHINVETFNETVHNYVKKTTAFLKRIQEQYDGIRGG